MFRWPRKKNMLLSHCAENNTFRLPLRSSNLKGQCHRISDLNFYCSKCFIWALYEHSKTVSQNFLFWQRFAKSMTKRTPEEGFWQNKRGRKSRDIFNNWTKVWYFFEYFWNTLLYTRTLAPMLSRMALALLKAASESAPTMKVSVPAAAAFTPPDTGASTNPTLRPSRKIH